ncbi:parafibromin-like isoform X2 [Homalodisca vitripennis]|nr:parafibromin-like isoform X2 [Homalodisca vitripennis]KAG8319619.1 accessory factor associated with RNA polymerase II [Homalodisca vitripennis]
MSDLLNVLRQYNMNKGDIIESNNLIVFGDLSWDKNVKTNYLMWGSGKNGAPKEYYTLESLLFLLEHVTLPHSTYVRQAVAENIPVVRRPDRKDLLAYLNGETTTSENIDKSAPVDFPTQVQFVIDESTESVAKKPKLDVMGVQTETKVDTVETYQGMSVTAVTGGDQPNTIAVPEIRYPQPVLAAVASLLWSSGYNRRISRTPMIVIPQGTSSLITMYNAKDLLQDLKFVSSREKKRQGAPCKNKIFLQRRKDGGLMVPYEVTDNPYLLTSSDWNRVVAVFAMGHTWDGPPLTGLPWNDNPERLFSEICGFHLKFEEMQLDPIVETWDVTLIQISLTKRHLDRAALMVFWETLDKHMMENKPHLRF